MRGSNVHRIVSTRSLGFLISRLLAVYTTLFTLWQLIPIGTSVRAALVLQHNDFSLAPYLGMSGALLMVHAYLALLLWTKADRFGGKYDRPVTPDLLGSLVLGGVGAMMLSGALLGLAQLAYRVFPVTSSVQRVEVALWHVVPPLVIGSALFLVHLYGPWQRYATYLNHNREDNGQ